MNSAKFLRTPRTTAFAFSFSKASTGGVLWKKVFLKISRNLQENTCGLWNFQEHLFYRTPLDDCFWVFPATLPKWGTDNSVWKTSDKYSWSRNTILRITVQVYHFFLGSINFQCMFSLVYTDHSRKQSPEWRCSVKKEKKRCSFVNFIGKPLCWSPFLIKLQVWHLFWRTSANDCFCAALAPLTVTYPFYFIFNTFFLIITATTVNFFVVCFRLSFSFLSQFFFSQLIKKYSSKLRIDENVSAHIDVINACSC